MIMFSASWKQGKKNITQKEELSDDYLMDIGLVMQRRFYVPHGKRDAIEKITTYISASMSPSGGGHCSLTIKCNMQW
jgi:hypothetical protein